jgi:hypothetical protein
MDSRRRDQLTLLALTALVRLTRAVNIPHSRSLDTAYYAAWILRLAEGSGSSEPSKRNSLVSRFGTFHRDPRIGVGSARLLGLSRTLGPDCLCLVQEPMVRSVEQ